MSNSQRAELRPLHCISKRVISPSVLPNFSWSVASPLNGAQVEGTADSFQNIFANAAAQPHWAPTSAPSNLASNWTAEANTAEAADDATASTQASPTYSDSEPVSEPSSNSDSTPTPGPAAEPASKEGSGSTPNSLQSQNAVATDSAQMSNQSPVRASQVNTKQVSTKQASTIADKKVDQPGHPLHAELRDGAVPGAMAAPAVPLHAVAGANHASAPGTAPARNFGIQQTGTDSTETTKSDTASLPQGAHILTGAAIALHVTPATNHNPNQKTASIAAATQPASAVATSPSDNAISEPSTPGVGVTDPANLLASAALVANSGAVRSSQVSAIGPSLGAANNTPWSASTSSPALLNNQAKPAESVSAAVPVAEVDVEDPAGSAQPVRTLQLQLGGTGDQRVDLRLVEHAGGLSVSVRASDSTLTRGLQDNLPELTSRLAAEHYQTQTWLPATGQTSPGGHSSGSPGQSSGQSAGHGGGHSSQGGSSSSGGQGNPQQDRRQDQTPAWWRQMASLGGAADSVSTSGSSESLVTTQ